MALDLRARGVAVDRGRRRVLEGVDLDATAGAITAILGPNGAGKSTLVRALAGVAPYEGEITLGGASLRALAPRERAQRLAYVPQRSELGAGLGVATVIGQGRYAHTGGLGRPGDADRRAIAAALERADVTALLDRRFDRLSTGEQRRVLLARALATEAKVILLDEPTASLDVRHALELHALLAQLAADDFTIVVVLHELDAARRFTDRAVLLDGGRVAAAGASDEVVSRESVERVYGVTLVEGGGLGFALTEGGP